MLLTLMPRRVDSIQEASAPFLEPEARDRIYWRELERMMLGTHALRGDTLRALRVVPLMRLGPLEGDRRAILGGLLAAEPGGTIAFEWANGLARVAVRGYAPRLPRPLYALQSRVHVALSRRYFRRLQRSRL